MRHRRAFAPPHSQRLAGVASARVAWLKARLPTPPRQSDAKPATPPVKRGMSKEQARGAAMRARCAAAPLYPVSAGADAATFAAPIHHAFRRPRAQKAKLRQEYIGFGGSETQARAASRARTQRLRGRSLRTGLH